MTLTELQLRVFLPQLAEAALWTAALNTACSRFEITTRMRLTAFLAQVAHESAGFALLVENLNYSAEGLRKTWPARFPTLESAQAYARRPEMIANRVYANRLGNGSEESGDGWRFRGRGLIMTTGRSNYRQTSIGLQVPYDEQPTLLEQRDHAALSAAYFWSSRGLNRMADRLDQLPVVEQLTQFDRISYHINGGHLGLAERRAFWARAKAAIPA